MFACSAADRAVSMKLHTVPCDFEPTPYPIRHREAIQPFVRQILNLSTAQANQMVMGTDIRIKPGPIVPIVDLVHKPGFLQGPQSIVDRVRRDHRV
jgi:hypothetical protein